MRYVLLVDDDVSFRQALSDILLVYFPMIDVDETGDEVGALSKVECLRPNIVFIDGCVSGGNGLELIKEIKRMCGDIVVVILTKNNQPEYRQEAFFKGADYYISKEDDSCMEDILVRIEETMARQVNGIDLRSDCHK